MGECTTHTVTIDCTTLEGAGYRRCHVTACSVDLIANGPVDQAHTWFWLQRLGIDTIRIQAGDEGIRAESVADRARDNAKRPIGPDRKTGGEQDGSARGQHHH